MVDENLGNQRGHHENGIVQIPLWSMKTFMVPQLISHIFSSDSSMVDENVEMR